MSCAASTSSPIPQRFLRKRLCSKMAPLSICLLGHSLNDPSILNALPKPRRHVVSHIVVFCYIILVLIRICCHLDRPIGLLLGFLYAEFALSKSVQYSTQCLVSHAPLGRYSAARCDCQLWYGITCCFGRVCMVVQALVGGYFACDARCEQRTLEVETQL